MTIVMMVSGTPQFPQIWKSSRGPVFPENYFKTPYPVLPGGGLFGKINKQHPFVSKGLR